MTAKEMMSDAEAVMNTSRALLGIFEEEKVIDMIDKSKMACNTFDKVILDNENTIDKGQKMMLDILVQEISNHEYTTFSELSGAINNHLDRLKAKNNE